MEGDLSAGDVNGSSLTYNPSAPSALGFGRSGSDLPPSAASAPHTTPGSLPHYSSPPAYSAAPSTAPPPPKMMVPTGGSDGPASLSASFSAPTGLCDSASPTSENGGGRPAPTTPPASALQRSHSTLSSSTSASKLENLRSWGVSAYKCTRQLLNERLGRSSRTVDAELETSIEALRDTQRRYAQVLRLARSLASHFWQVVCAQQQLAEAFGDLAQKSPELQEEFLHNAGTQRTLSRNGETLLAALNFFVSSVATLCHKTMEDTLATVRLYEQARVEYDAYRTDLEALTSTPRTQVSSIKLDEAQRQYSAQKNTYDQLRADVAVKLKFLNENKVKVMHKQLLLFHNAVSAYFSGNEAQLEATLRQFNVRVCGGGLPPSWLEQTSLS